MGCPLALMRYSGAQNSASRGLVEMGLDLDRAASPSTTVKVSSNGPLGSTPGGRPSSSKPKCRWPARRARRGLGDGQRPFRRRPLDEQFDRLAGRRLEIDETSGLRLSSLARRAVRPASRGGHRLAARALRRRRARHPVAPPPGASVSSAFAFGRHAQFLADRVVDLDAAASPACPAARGDDAQRKDHVVLVAEVLPVSSVKRCGAG